MIKQQRGRPTFRLTELGFLPEEIDKIKAGSAQALPWYERLHRESGNALLAWHAYLICRISGAPVPEWILAYFDYAILRLWGLKSFSPEDTAKAFGLRGEDGQRLVTTKFRQLFADIEVLRAVQQAMVVKRKEQFAIEDVAKRTGKSLSAIYKAMRRAQKYTAAKTS